MSRILIAACVAVCILAISLLPRASNRISAIPENLWTSSGQFGEPSKSQAVLEWNRAEYGIIWIWFVHDSSASDSSWYARIEPRYLALYTVGALMGGLISIFLTARRGKTKL
jgi:hypothetical protein